MAVVAVVAVAWLQAPTSAGARADGHERPSTRSSFTAAFEDFPDYLDPQLSFTVEGWAAMYNTYIPLLTYRHGGGRAGSDVVPGLARGLPEISDRGRTYTLFLRRGLRYSNGAPVRASHFRFAVERMFRLNSVGAPLYSDIVGAKGFRKGRRARIGGIVTNDRTGKIVIHLTAPRGTFVNELALTFTALVPPGTPARDRSFAPPPATGPYVITRSKLNGWSYARNPEWRGSNARLMPQLPSGHVDRIEIEVRGGAARQVREVERGKLDWMFGHPPSDQYARLARRYGGSRLRVEPMLATYYFWMNTTKPPFDDLRVREAVNYAVDRSLLRRIYGSELAPTQQILPPGMPGYKKFALFPHDIAKARSLVAEANPADREITVWASSEAPDREAAAYYRGRLQELGFDAHLKVVSPFEVFAVGLSRSDLDTGWSNWFADYPHPGDFFKPLLSGSAIGSGNLSRIDVPALNSEIAALNEVELGSAQERRYALLDRAFMKQAPWVPYGNPTLSTFVSTAIDPDEVILNPLIGPDLTSFRFK